MPVLPPTKEQIAALAARPADVPVVMINLLQFRKPDGAERYLEYGAAVAPHLERVGGQMLYAGGAPASVIGDDEPWWDAVIVVQYPSPAAFLDMIFSDDYQQNAHPLREQALERGDLIATSPWMTD
jgi:uncharacterized protein (DUF1330 family)